MFVCAHYEKKAAEVNETPLAVPVAWFLLGALLLSFDVWLLTLAALFILYKSGKSLYFRARMTACCMKEYRRARARGELREPCFSINTIA